MGAVIRAAYERTVKGFHWLIAVGSRAESVPVIGPLLALPIVVLVVVPIAGFAIVGWLLAMSVALMALTGPPAFAFLLAAEGVSVLIDKHGSGPVIGTGVAFAVWVWALFVGGQRHPPSPWER